MELFTAILHLRGATKKFLFVRKIIDFIPLLSTVDRFVYRYASVRIEEKKIVSYSLNESRPKINLVCDFKCTPPTYGDFSSFLTAIGILSLRFEVTFVMVIDELRSDWKELGDDEQSRRISDFRELADKVVANYRAELKIASSYSELLNLTAEGKTVFSDFVSKRKKIYRDLITFYNLLYKSIGCDQKVLLDQIEFSRLKLKPSFKYVLWHIRTESVWSMEHDLSDQEIVEIYEPLRRILGSEIEIVVCGNQKGLQRVMNLAAQRQLEITSARTYSENFLSDVTLLRKCGFFLQVGGGGLAEYALNSSVPYFISSFPWTKRDFKQHRFIPGRKNQVNMWQTANQVFLLKNPRSKDNFENQLKKFWCDLSVVE